jgi:hypothetical protein
MNCVNGKVMPFLEVEPRKYRFRILNASHSRFCEANCKHAFKKVSLREYFLATEFFQLHGRNY